MSVARIQLSPESLGSIQIHLQRTSDGIVARVVTERPETAAALSQSSDDLRQSLQQNGTQLLRLDIESQDQQRSSAQQQPAPSRSGSSGNSGDGEQAPDGTADGSAPISDDIPTQGLSSAALVNVLA
jgi:flagellar hook-length control protein FliK